MRLPTTILLGLGAGYAVAVPPSPFAISSAPEPAGGFRPGFRPQAETRLLALDVDRLARLFADPVLVPAAPDWLLDSEERGAPRDDVDYGLSCPFENDCDVDLSAPGWAPTSPSGIEEERFRSRFAGAVPAGVLIDRIQPLSLFARFGFRDGDVIRSINGLPFDRPDQAWTIHQTLRDRKSFWIEVERNGKRVWKTYRLHHEIEN